MGTERRVNERTPAKFKISYIHEGDYLISHSKDISVDGMFICTEKPPSTGEEITLTFSLDETNQFTVTAKVIWKNTTKDKRDKGVGVQFIDSTPQIKKTIKKIVNRIAIINDDE